MVINWYGEGCFKVLTAGVTILIDPFHKSTGLMPPRFKSDILIKTLTDYPLDYKEIENASVFGPGEYEIKGIEILGWPIPADEKSLKAVYLVKAGGLNLGVLGHLKDNPDVSVLEKLAEADIIFIPAGGAPYISQDAAEKLIKKINPLIVVASFFKIPGLKSASGDIKGFLKKLGQKANAQDNLVVKKKELPQNTKLVVLKA